MPKSFGCLASKFVDNANFNTFRSENCSSSTIRVFPRTFPHFILLQPETEMDRIAIILPDVCEQLYQK